LPAASLALILIALTAPVAPAWRTSPINRSTNADREQRGRSEQQDADAPDHVWRRAHERSERNGITTKIYPQSRKSRASQPPGSPTLRPPTGPRDWTKGGLGRTGPGTSSKFENAWAAEAAEIAGPLASIRRLPLEPWNSVRWSFTVTELPS
jgi:hypothetical protein